MTREDAVKVLSLLKAAYPNAYKGMTRNEGNGVIAVWATQFSDVPVEVVLIAINELIGTNNFPPAISEVKEKLKEIYWECCSKLSEDKAIPFLTDEQREKTKKIMDSCYGVKEPSVTSMIKDDRRALVDEAYDQ